MKTAIYLRLAFFFLIFFISCKSKSNVSLIDLEDFKCGITYEDFSTGKWQNFKSGEQWNDQEVREVYLLKQWHPNHEMDADLFFTNDKLSSADFYFTFLDTSGKPDIKALESFKKYLIEKNIDFKTSNSGLEIRLCK
jgi:hypothetical protein